jgi:DUF1009 family protein
VERTLGLIGGAGTLPALMATEARQQGWRVVAFAFGEAPGLETTADVLVPCRITDLAPVIGRLQAERVSAAILSGKFWMEDLLKAGAPDVAHTEMAARARTLTDSAIADAIATTLVGLGITLLDQRPFLGAAIDGVRAWSARIPTEDERSDIRRGLQVARALATAGVGQTVVVRRGVIAAVEAMEGTTEAIRRGTGLAGPGAVVVKATGAGHDFRFDVPGIGPETIAAAAAGRACVVAIEAGRVFVVDRAATIDAANAASIALLGVDTEP